MFMLISGASYLAPMLYLLSSAYDVCWPAT